MDEMKSATPWVLPPDASEKFVEELVSPLEPNDALREAIARYEARLTAAIARATGDAT